MTSGRGQAGLQVAQVIRDGAMLVVVEENATHPPPTLEPGSSRMHVQQPGHMNDAQTRQELLSKVRPK